MPNISRRLENKRQRATSRMHTASGQAWSPLPLEPPLPLVLPEQHQHRLSDRPFETPHHTWPLKVDRHLLDLPTTLLLVPHDLQQPQQRLPPPAYIHLGRPRGSESRKRWRVLKLPRLSLTSQTMRCTLGTRDCLCLMMMHDMTRCVLLECL
jgi:hypothetical protein